jgi:hypothetical protein
MCSFVWAKTLSAQPDNTVLRIKRQRKAYESIADSVYQWRIKQPTLNGVYIPKDLNDCFVQLDKLMDEDAKKTFMAFSDQEVDMRTHNTLGRWIQYKWELAEGSRISEYFRQMQIPHYDYMVSLIITSYHRRLHGRDLKLKEQVKFYREHWQKIQRRIAAEMERNQLPAIK